MSDEDYINDLANKNASNRSIQPGVSIDYPKAGKPMDPADHPATSIPTATEDHSGTTLSTDAYDMMKQRQYNKVPRDGKWPK